MEEKKLESELAKVEADAWSKNVSDSQEKPHYHAKDLPSTSKSKGPFVTFKPSKEPIRPTTFVPLPSRSLTDLPFSSRDVEHSNHQEPFATKTLARSPQRNFQSFLSASPQPPLSINDRRLTEFYSKRERRVLPIVIRKFDGCLLENLKRMFLEKLKIMNCFRYFIKIVNLMCKQR